MHPWTGGPQSWGLESGGLQSLGLQFRSTRFGSVDADFDCSYVFKFGYMNYVPEAGGATPTGTLFRLFACVHPVWL